MDEALVNKPMPAAPAERIVALDVLRGFAVLGILLMNIQSFSMIGAAYFNPSTSGYFEGLDRSLWILIHVVADQKFMTLFSLLFGAGIVLIANRTEAASGRPALLHYRRTFWLLIIGAGHAYLFWIGDVLVWYGLSALIVFWFRKCSPRNLLLFGLLTVSIGSLLSVWIGSSLDVMPPESVEEFATDWAPNAEAIRTEVEVYRGTWSEQQSLRVPVSAAMHTIGFLFFALWRAGGLMLVGMALLKWGVFGAERSATFYRRLALLGLGIGVPLVSLGVAHNISAGWTLAFSRFFGEQYNYWGSLFVSAGYIGLVMLAYQRSVTAGWKQRLAAVGKMALTNYLAQTVLCTWICYGHGLGAFASLSRAEQTGIVLAIWALQLLWSPIWLRHFRFGPAEWCWRSLTYWKLQPLRIR